MSGDSANKKPDCQLQVVYEAGEKPNLGTRLRHIFLRFQSALRRRTVRPSSSDRDRAAFVLGRVNSQEAARENDGGRTPASSGRRQVFRAGEMVRIKSLEEIQSTLDPEGRCEGLQFMMGMQKYCGRQARVIKKVRMMFDERLWKMVQIRRAYILEGIICDGRNVFEGEGCDRTCFYFSKDKWLEKA